MAEIAPLTPLRYELARVAGGLQSVIAPPYDVISPAERAELASRDPHNVVRLILPEGHGDSKYAHAAELLSLWQKEGILVRDPEPSFYRYDQTFELPGGAAAGRVTRRGFLALVKLVPFDERVVLPHERTLSGPKEDRLKLFRATGANLSPGFMLYSDSRGELQGQLDEAERLAEYTAGDGVHHVLAKVRKPSALRAMVQGLAGSSLLIADGHHRYETALRYSQEVTARHPASSALAEHRYFLTFLVCSEDPGLVVLPTHRHVHSLASFSFDELVRRARDVFVVQELARGTDSDGMIRALRQASSLGPSLVGAASDGRAVVLTLRGDVDLEAHPTLGKRPRVLRRVDVVLLHTAILEHILGITPEAQAAKTNLSYPQDARTALAELRAGAGNVLFLLNPTPVAQVRQVSESGEVMPQKSTFFYPKVPTGLVIHTLDPTRLVVRTLERSERSD